jgi:hypothetical protein
MSHSIILVKLNSTISLINLISLKVDIGWVMGIIIRACDREMKAFNEPIFV